MSEKCLSVFVDESGDFGPYEAHAPYYFVSMVLHDQHIDIHDNVRAFEAHLIHLGYPHHAVHAGPLIRRESVYKNELMETRRRLFGALFNFTRKIDVNYACAMVRKSECPDVVALTAKLSKELATILRDNAPFWNRYERIIVYYDNGQIELTKILSSVFSTLYAHVEFRKVKPADYKLFQVADLICTAELLEEKSSFTRSESDFFNNKRDFRKNFLKPLRKKHL